MGLSDEEALKGCLQNVVDAIKIKDTDAGDLAQTKLDDFWTIKKAEEDKAAAEKAAAEA